MFRRKTLFAIIFMFLVTFIGGCANDNDATQVTPKEENKSTEQQVALPNNQKDPASANSQDKMVITVYNATKDAMYLVCESHVVAKNDHPAQTAMELLLAGTKNVELLSVIPSGTALRNIWIKDKVAYVDFNDKLVKNNKGGSASEILLVGSIVNTLTEFHDIQKVQILVEGKKIDTISGHLEIGEPLSRSEKIIKK